MTTRLPSAGLPAATLPATPARAQGPVHARIRLDQDPTKRMGH